jgi:hypothetical protein
MFGEVSTGALPLIYVNLSLTQTSPQKSQTLHQHTVTASSLATNQYPARKSELSANALYQIDLDNS